MEIIKPEEQIEPQFSEQTSFLDMAAWGKAGGWRYFIAIVLSLIFYVVVGNILFLIFIVLAAGGMPEFDNSGELVGVDPIMEYLGLNLSIMPILFTALLCIKLVHKRPVMSLISPVGKVRWNRVFKGFILWFVLASMWIPVDMMLYPKAVYVSFDAQRFLTQLPIILLVTPIQTTAEEVFFRGWVLQGLSRVTKNFWFLVIVNGLIFGLPHLFNKEVAFDPLLVVPLYIGIGVMLAFVTLRSNGLEYALGIHAGNNLFSLIYGFETSSLPVPSILTCKTLHPLTDLISFVITATVMCLLVSHFCAKEDKLKKAETGVTS